MQSYLAGGSEYFTFSASNDKANSVIVRLESDDSEEVGAGQKKQQPSIDLRSLFASTTTTAAASAAAGQKGGGGGGGEQQQQQLSREVRVRLRGYEREEMVEQLPQEGGSARNVEQVYHIRKGRKENKTRKKKS